MKTTRHSGGNGHRKVVHSVHTKRNKTNKDEPNYNDEDHKWRHPKDKVWDTYDAKSQSRKSSDTSEKENKNYGKTTHVEDWEEDPYMSSSKKMEESVKGEFEVRGKGGDKGKDKKSKDGTWGEQHRWRLYNADSEDDEDYGGDENRKSGNDETLGVP
jgi:hypothetical protein